MATTSRGWRKVADNENDKAQAVNDALDDASADLDALEAQIGDGTGTAGGNTAPSATATVNIPATKSTWTATGILVTAGSATVLHATGLASASAGVSPTGPNRRDDNGAHLNWIVATDSTLPPVDSPARNHYYEARDVDDSVIGQIYLCFSAYDHAGNQGSLDVTLTKYDDANSVSAVARVSRARVDVLQDTNFTTQKSIAAIQARLDAGGL